MGWRAALAGLTLLGSMWTGGGAVADQTDGRLNDLFEVLAEAQHLDDATRAADGSGEFGSSIRMRTSATGCGAAWGR